MKIKNFKRNFESLERIAGKAAVMLTCAMIAASTASCSDDDSAPKGGIKGTTVTAPEEVKSVSGLFVLNEGQMNKNKCSLDYFDRASGRYYRSLFAAVNPDVVLGLGDTGNDLQEHDGRLYAVVNGSGLVEVMDAATLRHIGTVLVPGCRSIAFIGKKGYVTSYAGESGVTSASHKGTVVEIDLATLRRERTCVVGLAPDGIAARDGKLFVANSCVYDTEYAAHYDRTVSVVDALTMTEEQTITVAPNLNAVQADARGKLYVISRGDYLTTPSDVYVVDTDSRRMVGRLDVRAASMCLAGDSLYIVGSEFSSETYSNALSFTLYDVKRNTVVSQKFITDGTDAAMTSPYGIAVNPDDGSIFITDAGNFVLPGTLYCFSRTGKLRWKTTTGDIPGHLLFTATRVQGLE